MSGATTSLLEALRAAGFRGELRGDEPLAPYTTWRIGGPAQLLASPADPDDLRCALDWARRDGVAWRVLGNGSNLLVRDEGVRGLVLRTRRAIDALRVEAPRIYAGAGASFPALANLAASAGLAGLEFAAGIPGTVGGALVMNAAWQEHEVAAVVQRVRWLDEAGVAHDSSAADCAFAYRHSAFRGRRCILLEATLQLHADDPARIRARLDEYAASRRKGQPTELPSCGSVFLKPPGDFAGRLIDAAELKGERRGQIQVSPKHANFFVNLGGGTARDALALIEHVEATVLARCGVQLVREVELW